jgi:hypothetical protein
MWGIGCSFSLLVKETQRELYEHSPWRKLLMKPDRTDKGILWEWLQACETQTKKEPLKIPGI